MRRLLLSCTLLFMMARTQAQLYTQVNYAGSGLTNTVATGSNADVLAGNPVIGGLTHTTLSSFGSPYNVDAPPQTMQVNPPGFDGSSLYIGAQSAFVWLPNGETENHFIIDAYSMNYTFQPGYTWFVTLHYSGNSSSGTPGIGMTTGAASMTLNFSQFGSAMSSYYNNVPMGVVNHAVDQFLANPQYNAWLSTITNPTFTDLTFPSFTVGSSTTGLNLEALPAGGATYLEIGSVTIVGIPPINPVSGPICSSTTVSIPDPNGWPVSWSISPAIATLSPSGSSVTVTQTGNGPATLTASVTGPDGRVYQTSTSFQVGTQDLSTINPIGIVPGSETIPANSPAQFICDGANFWTVSDGTIIGGQNTYNVDVQTNNDPGGTLYVTAYAQNACGLGTGLTNTYSITAGGPPGDSYHTPAATDSTTAFNNDSLAANANIFPNPATNSVQVILPKTDFTRTYIKLYDLSGHLLRMIIPSGTSTQIDVSHWAKGTYIISVYDGRQLKTGKLLKQ